MVHKDLILKKLSELDRYLSQLTKFHGITAGELDDNLDKRWIIERGLQVCIQAVLDIGNHILSEKGIAVDSYKDILNELGKLEIIPPDFAGKIKGMAGLRNILVHEYARVDTELLAGIVNKSLDDFKDFAGYILESIKD